MKKGYKVINRGIENPSTVWVLNFPYATDDGEVHNVCWDDTEHIAYDNPYLTAIFKIKPKNNEKSN